MRRLLPAFVIAATLAGGVWTGVVHGALVLDFTGGGTVIVGGGPLHTTVAGWEFKVTSAITVDGIGVFDVGSDGLTAAHDVGLWNGDGSVLFVSTIVTNAATIEPSTSADGDWLFVGIGPLTLLPGNYVLGARYGEDPPDTLRGVVPGLIPGDSVTTAAGVTLVQSRAKDSATLAFPDIAFAPPSGVFGPNLRLAPTPAAVPESSTFLLFSSGLNALAGCGRRRSPKAHHSVA